SNTLFFRLTTPATTVLSTLSLHDALPICARRRTKRGNDLHRRQCQALTGRCRCRKGSVELGSADGLGGGRVRSAGNESQLSPGPDRKSTRLNSSHEQISYAVFCLKKKT